MINGHGDDLHLFKGQIKYNFSSNVYYKGCAPELLKLLANSVQQIQNYPSPLANELSERVAEKYSLTPQQVLFGNGATELFYLIAHCFTGKSAGIVAPTFAEYEDACKLHQLSISFFNSKNIFEQKQLPDLVFICNPNNPDGVVFAIQALETLFQQHPNTTFVVDEAYIEFTVAIPSLITQINQHPNLILIRSLTKTFAIPGLRLGYLVGNQQQVAALMNFKMPWTVNQLAIIAGKYILDHYDRLCFNPTILLQEANHFRQQLQSISEIEVIPSHTSYGLLNLQQGTASEVKYYLADQHQILVRDASNFNGIKGEKIRVSCQDQLVNHKLIEGLKNYFSN